MTESSNYSLLFAATLFLFLFPIPYDAWHGATSIRTEISRIPRAVRGRLRELEKKMHGCQQVVAGLDRDVARGSILR